MDPFFLLAVLLTLAALASYLNHRWAGLPTTVALMGISLALALGTIGASELGLPWRGWIEGMLREANLSGTLLGGALSFLLFAAALNLEFKELQAQRWRVASLAFFSTALSIGLVAGLTWWICRWLGINLPLLYCLIFGSLISPTDPVAVVGLLKKAGAPLSLETKIAGESLFNDGVGIVGFSLFVESLLDTGPQMDVNWGHAAILLVREAGGGILLGLVLGWVAFKLIKGVDHHPVEILLTLALVSGGYALGLAWHVSGPLVVATSGVLIGHFGRKDAMSEKTRESLDAFWELIDEILNALLFVLVGLQVTAVNFTWDYFTLAALLLAAVLVARAVSVLIPALALRAFGGTPERHGTLLFTWGGLRGAISVALALSLPAGHEHDLILASTYGIVAFSILVQGTTFPVLLRRLGVGERMKVGGDRWEVGGRAIAASGEQSRWGALARDLLAFFLNVADLLRMTEVFLRAVCGRLKGSGGGSSGRRSVRPTEILGACAAGAGPLALGQRQSPRRLGSWSYCGVVITEAEADTATDWRGYVFSRGRGRYGKRNVGAAERDDYLWTVSIIAAG